MHGELALGGADFDPVNLHVPGLEGSLLYRVAENFSCALFVSFKRSASLGMAHFSSVIQRDVAYFALNNRANSSASLELYRTAFMMDYRTFRVPLSGSDYGFFW